MTEQQLLMVMYFVTARCTHETLKYTFWNNFFPLFFLLIFDNHVSFQPLWSTNLYKLPSFLLDKIFVS